ncbi:MAG: glycoside hydrolase family 140 protein [Thermoguttaceae bacterium]|nr:glycoside hydrolase family 140 protein [Thermoguttaceae bacterium]MDW8079542.1 glycoside hydrolase family 140 protein [Thermoguttaceae bacterium]
MNTYSNHAKTESLRLISAALSAAWFFVVVVDLSATLASEPAVPRLRVSDNRRYLVNDRGEPFFYLGDTAWELFHRTTREEADLYLRDRASKGFTVIQAVVLAELDGLRTPNAYGHLPLVDDDPTKPLVREGPENDYWDHVDWIVDRAAELGLFIGMLPTWGDKWNKKWGVGPEIFTPENAEIYGRWLGERYRDKPIIWILGGDRNPENDRHLAIIRAMARGLRAGDGGNHLFTYHPQGGADSARWFHQDDWLNFNMFQSGHGQFHIPNYLTTLRLRELEPTKPVLDGEPRYEDHPVGWRAEKGWFDDWDVRQAAYWSMLSGACGHTYGNHNIWQMWEPPRQPVSYARTPWKKALAHPGSAQMGLMRKILTLRPFWKLVPDQSLIAGQEGEGGQHRRAARAEDGSFALIYLPTGGTVEVSHSAFGAKTVRCWWFDPRNGKTLKAGDFSGAEKLSVKAPGEGRGQDWLLIVDNAEANLPPPEISK